MNASNVPFSETVEGKKESALRQFMQLALHKAVDERDAYEAKPEDERSQLGIDHHQSYVDMIHQTAELYGIRL